MTRPSLLPHQRPQLYQADVANLEAWVLLALTECGAMTVRELRDVLGLRSQVDPERTKLHRAVRALIAAGKVGEVGGAHADGPARPWTVWAIGGAS